LQISASPDTAAVHSWCPSTTGKRDGGSKGCALEVTFSGEKGKTSEKLCGEHLCRWSLFSF